MQSEVYKGLARNYKGRDVEILESRDLCLKNAVAFCSDWKFLRARAVELNCNFDEQIRVYENQWRSRVRWLKANKG